MLNFANKKFEIFLKNLTLSKVLDIDRSLCYGIYLSGFNDGVEYVQKKLK